MAPSRGTAARLSLALICAFAALAATATGASAGCPICDQYTLDIPDPKGGGNGGNSGGNGDSSAPDPDPAPAPAPAPAATPAPVPATPAPAPAPAPTAPATATASQDEHNKKHRRKHKQEPNRKPELVQTDATAAAPEYASSEPLVYDEGDSAPQAALAGLGSPGTVALLAALLAAGATVALARRRAASR